MKNRTKVNHRFVLSSPALVSAPLTKIIIQLEFPELGVQRLQIDWIFSIGTTPASGDFIHKHLPTPFGDRNGMLAELFEQFCHRLIFAHHCQSYSCLEHRRVRRADFLTIETSLTKPPFNPASITKFPPKALFRFAGPLLPHAYGHSRAPQTI